MELKAKPNVKKEVNKNINKKSKSEIEAGNKIFILGIMILIVSSLFLGIGLNANNMDYALSQRIPKLLSIILTGVCISISTTIFQTITGNKILTPNVMGLDSVYVLIQTVIVFVLGSSSVFIVNKKYNFVICVAGMIALSSLLYKLMFKKENSNILFLLLVGMIFGTLFSSLSSFMQMVIDPNEFLVLQNKLFASFNNVNVDILLISIILIILVIPFICDDLKYLDVINLGRDQAINLGIDYDKLVRKLFVTVAIFISISTALVGPITFLGLLVVNLSRQMINTYKHKYLITMSVLLSVFVLVTGQLLAERIFDFSTPVSVIINLIGGIYFMYLLLKESRI